MINTQAVNAFTFDDIESTGFQEILIIMFDLFDWQAFIVSRYQKRHDKQFELTTV